MTYYFFLRQIMIVAWRHEIIILEGAWRLLYNISPWDVKILKVVSLYLIISTIEIDTFYDRRWTALTVYCMRHINTFSGHSSVQRSTIMLPYSLSLSPPKKNIYRRLICLRKPTKAGEMIWWASGLVRRAPGRKGLRRSRGWGWKHWMRYGCFLGLFFRRSQ